MNPNTDLVRLAKFRDTHAFARLYETVYKDLYRFALYTLRHPQDAEDAVSETVVDAFAQIQSLKDAAAFRSWIFRILSAKCSRRIRQYINAPSELPDELREEAFPVCEQVDIRRALDSLPEEDRLIISMSIFAGYSSQEIGDLLKMNPGTVRSRQSRALKKLESLLS